MSEPVCPKCSANGIGKITCKPCVVETDGGEAMFHVAYCADCGHVYGVFVKSLD